MISIKAFSTEALSRAIVSSLSSQQAGDSNARSLLSASQAVCSALAAAIARRRSAIIASPRFFPKPTMAD
jgi:hypothetical protein